MREQQVRAATVNVEAYAEGLLGHRRALDVPPGTTVAPRRGPPCVLVGLARLPQGKIEWVLLALDAFQAFALVEVLDATVRERAVTCVGADPEEHVTAALIRVTGVD